jgi:hypothetical protein
MQELMYAERRPDSATAEGVPSPPFRRWASASDGCSSISTDTSSLKRRNETSRRGLSARHNSWARGSSVRMTNI